MLPRVRKSMADKDQGFTLIELLVVIIIIGILAAIAIPVFLNQRKKAVDAGLKSDLKQMAALQESYVVDNPTMQGVSTADSGVSWFNGLTGGSVVAPNAPVFKKTGTNYVTVRNTLTGYCVGASNPGASQAVAMYYDSEQGGVIGFKASRAIAGGNCV